MPVAYLLLVLLLPLLVLPMRRAVAPGKGRKLMCYQVRIEKDRLTILSHKI